MVINKYELFFGRGALMDQISILRALGGAAETAEDLCIALETIFVEQRTRMRSTVNLTGPYRFLFHAMMLRPTLLGYLSARFPRFAEGTAPPPI